MSFFLPPKAINKEPINVEIKKPKIATKNNLILNYPLTNGCIKANTTKATPILINPFPTSFDASLKSTTFLPFYISPITVLLLFIIVRFGIYLALQLKF